MRDHNIQPSATCSDSRHRNLIACPENKEHLRNIENNSKWSNVIRVMDKCYWRTKVKAAAKIPQSIMLRSSNLACQRDVRQSTVALNLTVQDSDHRVCLECDIS